MVDLNLYPDVPKVEWTYSTLEPGDCIFIPSGKLMYEYIPQFKPADHFFTFPNYSNWPSSSETQGQLVGARESRNGRKKKFGEEK